MNPFTEEKKKIIAKFFKEAFDQFRINLEEIRRNRIGRHSIAINDFVKNSIDIAGLFPGCEFHVDFRPWDSDGTVGHVQVYTINSGSSRDSYVGWTEIITDEDVMASEIRMSVRV